MSKVYEADKLFPSARLLANLCWQHVMSQDLSENNNVTELSNYDSANGVYAYLSEGERHIAKPIEKLLNGLTVEDASRVLIKVRRSLLSKSVVKLS